LAILGSVVLGTLALCFLPFLSSWPLLSQVLHRMFPFARGLYEDKVANVWCATSVVIKWHLWFPRETMVRVALLSTMASFLPACVHVFLRPSRLAFLYTLASTSFSFYLFSFQVHEKSILLPLLPVVLLWGRHPLLNAWIGCVATFSMFPLLQKDGHALDYFAMQAVFVVLALSVARAQLRQSEATSAPPQRSMSANWVSQLLARAHQRPMLLYRLVQVSCS
jgi:alpha-1,3-glucosyltransferase